MCVCVCACVRMCMCVCVYIYNSFMNDRQQESLVPVYRNKSNSTAMSYKWRQICGNSLVIIWILENKNVTKILCNERNFSLFRYL